jgi:hypothetical protein
MLLPFVLKIVFELVRKTWKVEWHRYVNPDGPPSANKHLEG